MSYETVEVSRDGAVATVLMNRPESVNSINDQMRMDLAAALQSVAKDSSIRAVVLAGAGRLFCAGADLTSGMVDGDGVEDFLRSEYRPSFDAISAMRKPVISAVNGSAAGIGLSLALACDLGVMADNAFLLSPFATIGLVPDGGATWFLVRQLGYHRAYQLAIECERIPAQRAIDLGLLNRIAPSGEAITAAQSWAAELATRAPYSLAATKRAMRLAMHASYDETYSLEASLQNMCIDSDDFTEGVAAFFEKRPASFKGR